MKFEWKPQELELLNNIAQCADELGFSAFLVGGYVRDKILNRTNKDIDIMCLGSGIALAQAVHEKFYPNSNLAVYKNFGTALIKTDVFEIEFVGARKESYRSDSRKPIVETGTLHDDIFRRDFTINSLAIQINKNEFGTLVDLCHGLEDLQQELIQTPLDADITFSDDPLRMLRCIRFASQLHFKIATSTFDAIKKNAHRIKIISQERITDELNKIILSSIPSIGFKLLDESGLLEIIFPEFVNLKGAEYIDGKGHKDNFYHTLQVLDNLSFSTQNLWLRWAAILHDIAKPATKKFDAQHGWTFHGHEVVGARMVKKIFNKFKLPLHEEMRYVSQLVLLHLRPISLTKENITDSAIRRLLVEAGDDIDDLMLLCQADITSKNKTKVLRYLENFEMVKQKLAAVEAKDKLRNWQPPITGQHIIETFMVEPSQIVGIVKEEVKNNILDGIIENNYEAAFANMITIGKKHGLLLRKK